MIKAVVSDFGGVVTLPLMDAFKRAHTEIGIPIEALAKAMALVASRADEPPLWTLERGQMSEPDFIAVIAGGLSEVLGRPVDLDGYGARLMASLEPNEPLLDHYRALRARGVRLAILTNNVREWHDAWRRKIPVVDELFELIVDSGFEGTRKPEPQIYELTLSRLGLNADACAFVDDVEVNVTAARQLGMHGIHFRETSQVIAELDALFA
ncbi:HAD family phosphatase [Solirubrobacter ginsenosidimutans]|uniref:HAD family phosphatase n=1 Tax=Solirubrobacter ginsenosidimutans TaxID=490573 RepID=A0A9X3N0M3_9ACTN|nr:HAD family phosphatase [Solirubrobacter ginsenosidimutans]MDA0165131.1 HAD family phosphatase [Solirubrobacter ginsenosidimutans]